MASWKKDSSGNWKKSESSKKNYTIVNGQKVEKTTATASAPSTSSDTWNKDTVTLEEAAQQTKDVESGVINVDTGSTSIETPATTETISLEQAATQTQTESANRVLASEAAQNPIEPVTQNTTTTTSYDPTTDNYSVTKVTDTTATYNNLSTIKAGSSIKSAAQLDPITVTETESKTETYNIGSLRSKTYLTPLSQELNSNRITADDFQEEKKETTSSKVVNSLESIYNSVKNSTLVSSVGNALDSVAESKLVQADIKIASAITGVDISDVNLPSVSQVASSALYGLSGGEKGSIPTSDKEYITASIAKKGQDLSEYIESKGSAFIDKGLNVLSGGDGKLTVLAPSGSLTTISTETVGSVVKGATLDTASFLITGASAVPLVAEVAVRDPEVLPSALISGGALLVGGTVKTALDDPARLAGQIIGGAALSKAAGVGGTKVSEAANKISLEKTPTSFKTETSISKPSIELKSATEAVDLSLIKVSEPIESNYVPIKKATATEVVDLSSIKVSEPVKSNYIPTKKATSSRVIDLESIEVSEPIKSNYISMKKATVEGVDLEAVLKFHEERNTAWLIEEQAMNSPKVTTRAQYFESGEKILQDRVDSLKAAGIKTTVQKSELSFYEGELSTVQKSKSLQMMMDDTASTYLPEIATKRRPSSQLVLEKPRITQTEFNKLLSDTGRGRSRVKFRTNKDLMKKAKQKVEARKAAKVDETIKNAELRRAKIGDLIPIILPAMSIKPSQNSGTISSIEQVPGFGMAQSTQQKVVPITGVIPATAFKISTTPVQKVTPKQTPSQQTPSRQQEPSIKDPVKPPREPIKTPSGVPRMPRLKVIPPAEITPRKARHSKKKGKKSKVEIDTIKNTYIDPMKALGRRKL